VLTAPLLNTRIHSHRVTFLTEGLILILFFLYIYLLGGKFCLKVICGNCRKSQFFLYNGYFPWKQFTITIKKWIFTWFFLHYKESASKSLQSTEISLYLAFTNELNVAQKEKKILMNDWFYLKIPSCLHFDQADFKTSVDIMF
jgi:hypothetical protein